MKVLGLTGGVGMGKSTAAGIFLTLGVRVIDTDELARQLVQPGQPALALIQAEFGSSFITGGGELNRDELARLVFADDSARKKLENILHPRIRESWLAQVELWKNEKAPLGIVVIPLLFETLAEAHFNRIICVACSSATQRERLLARGWSPAHMLRRIATQWPVELKMARSDFVLWTEGVLETTTAQVMKVYEQIL